MKKEFSMIYEGLNQSQREAVEHIEGPSLIVAGAGSGKTRVLTCRIANILSNGHSPSSVLALTFTNKASGEMKNRIAGIVGWERARYLWMGTFHSVFVRFLREDAQLLGFPKSFTIYDQSDSRSAIRGCIKELQLDEKDYRPGEIASKISLAKNNLITASAYSVNQNLLNADNASKKSRFFEIYKLYEKRCKQSGAMDFDDILLYTNILIRDNPDVLAKLQRRFNFILVDEYQDTNYAQYLIVKKLAQPHGNICVVGDDSQSIYGFRGARIENILNFIKDYPKVREFRLEENFRSTQTIVNAANSLISRNSMRLKKECFSRGGKGEQIEVMSAWTDQEEAFLLASSILSKIYQDKASYGDFAVLYRTNAQSRAVEEALRKRSLPYKIFGGHSFYERAEVKDMLSYLRLLANKKDNEAFKRVISVPPRGIGDTTMGRLSAAANAEGLSLWEALVHGDLASMGIKAATANRLFSFVSVIDDLSKKAQDSNVYDVALEALIRTGLMEFLKADTSVEGRARLDNVEELLNSIKAFVEEQDEQLDDDQQDDQLKQDNDQLDVQQKRQNQLDQQQNVQQKRNGQMDDQQNGPLKQDGQHERQKESSENIKSPRTTLPYYLENIALLSAQDENNSPEESNKISLMTVHTAKGLEFPYVYVIGLEENLFPSGSMMGIPENEMEEERRLFYVGLTRARISVTLSYAKSRFRWGSHVNYPPSRFLKEIDPKYLDWPSRESDGDSAFKGGSFMSLGNSASSRNGESYNSGSKSHFGGRVRSSDNTGTSTPKSVNNLTPNSVGSSNSVGASFPNSVGASSPNSVGTSAANSAGTFTPGRKSNEQSARTVPAPKQGFVPDAITSLKVGQKIEHDRFGIGEVVFTEGENQDTRATINFENWGKKILLLKFAKLRLVE
ncbi:MAG: UvrD-helicase domain-containing protein [Bacteroidales bacterium]|nr:UvrD-helicase domain-containing protein [Bacteroidales bacterium]